MNNWLTTLLKREPKTADTAAENPPKTTPRPLKYGLQTTQPIGQKKTAQPLAVLQKLSPFSTLDAEYYNQLLHHTLRYSSGSVIFLQGEQAQAVYYLLSGSVVIHPDTDDHFDLSLASPTQPIASYEIDANSSPANLPINSGRIFGATAIAKTPVDILIVSHAVINAWTNHLETKAKGTALVDLHLPQDLNQNAFFLQFAQAYHKNALQLPSLPNVAIKLRNAMQEDISIRDAVNIIQLDPAIVSKLIQVANSALYAPQYPIKNCHDAITRLGLNATRTLVMSINLQQLFQCKNKLIMQQLQNAWKQSLLVSSLCFVLAEEIGGINPEEALLAGLINDIGLIPLLHFAEQYLSESNDDLQAVLDTLPYLRAPVGRMVLNSLDFSEELIEIPYDAENWFYDSGDTVQLIDIVILAKLHSYLGTEKAKDLPYINSIPAYSKLKSGKLSPDFSLALLHKAQQRIHTAISALS